MNEFTIWGNTVISFQSIWIQLLQFSSIEVFFIFALMLSHFPLNPFIHGAFRCESKCDSRWGQTFALTHRICRFWFNPLIDNDICAFAPLQALLCWFSFLTVSLPVICNKNKETTSQPLPEKYSFSFSHILWENIPKHYGNLFPQNEGIFSQAVGNVFP